MMKKVFSFMISLLNAIIVIFTIILVFISIFKPELFILFIEWMKWIIYSLWNWNYLIAFLSSCIESFPVLWMLLPWQNIMLVVWWFFWQYNQIGVISIAIIWAIVWNYIWYIMWYYSWEVFFEKYGHWFWIGKTEVSYIKKWINKYWAWAVILSKFHPVSRAFIPFIAGSMWMRQPAFILYNVIWSIIWATTIIVLGVVFVTYYKSIIEYFGYIVFAVLLCLSLYIYKYKNKEFKEYLRLKEEELNEKYPVEKIWRVEES